MPDGLIAVPQRRDGALSELVVFSFGQHIFYPFGGFHLPDFHIDADIGEVLFYDIQQNHVTGGIGNNIGFKSVGITGIGQ